MRIESINWAVIAQGIDQISFILKLVMEAGVVGGIAVTVIWFLMTRIVKGMDDDRTERRMEHRQNMLWMATVTRSLMTNEKILLLHDATVHGINLSAGETQPDRDATFQRKLDAILPMINDSREKLDRAIANIDQSLNNRTL